MSNGDSFLVNQFRDFYREVIRWKERAVRDPLAFRPPVAVTIPPSPVPVSSVSNTEEAVAATIWQSLVEQLERQAVAVRRSGGEFAAEVFREAQYAMAALADEVFLHLDWRGRDEWQGNLLEQRLFATHRAGDVIFERIERILRARDPLDVDLAKIYLMVLALGFQGRYRGSADGQARIDTYRRQLYAFITNEDPDAPREAKPLFSEAYTSTLEMGEGRRVAPASRWFLGVFLLLILWVLVSHQLWRGLITDMEPIVQRILVDDVSAGRPPSTR